MQQIKYRSYLPNNRLIESHAETSATWNTHRKTDQRWDRRPDIRNHVTIMKSANLAQHFLDYFDVVPANTSALKQEVYRLRHDVYCKEFKHEPIDDHPDGMETDEYDPYSLHVLVKHKSTGLTAGCTRIIPADPTNKVKQLPIEELYSDKPNICNPTDRKIPRHSICEASRLCVHSSFRRRHGESVTPLGDLESLHCSQKEHRTFPLISLSISLATTALTELIHRPYMFAMMEPSLPRLLHRIGYEFIQTGAKIDYHGNRAGYYVETGSVLRNLQPEFLELYLAIRKTLAVLNKTAA